MTPEEQREFRSALIAQLPALRRYATGLVGNASWADDLVQDCIERALKSAATLERLDRVGAWLRSIVHNAYLSELRRRKRIVPVDIADLDNTLGYSVEPADRSTMRQLLRGVASLSVEHRQVLLLIGVEGLSYRETAEELGVPIGTVMSRLARAREKLRSVLEERQAGSAEVVAISPGKGPR